MKEKQAGSRGLSLKKIYNYSFLGLVVIPLVLVFLTAGLILWFVTQKSAKEMVAAFQENVATTIENDVKLASLQLSHFIYANDGEFVRNAIHVYETEEPSALYEANQVLERNFNTAMVPSQSILAGRFYMRRGGGVSMKDDVMLADEEIKASAWYQKALGKANTVAVGAYDSTHTRLVSSTPKAHQLVLVTAMALDAFTDRSDTVEAVSFFTISNAGAILKDALANPPLGHTVLLDEGGTLIYGDFGEEALQRWFVDHGSEFLELEGSSTRRADPTGTGHEVRHLFSTRYIQETGWTVVTFVPLENTVQEFVRIVLILMLVAISLLGLFYLFSRYFLNAIVQPVQMVADGMNRLVGNDWEVQLAPTGHRELRTLMESFNMMVRSLKNMLISNERTQERKRKAEYQALQMQINPHFIVNSLNSIRFMAQMAGFGGIQKMAESLIKIVSCSFRSATELYTVREELEVLDSFAYIMRIRYSDGFNIHYDVEHECLNYKLPRLLLQPVVENSVTHGFEELDEELGEIKVTVRRDGDFLSLSVWDNGCGMSPEKVEEILDARPELDKGASIGLPNVLSRIRLYFGDVAKMRIESAPGSTTVELQLPLTKLEREEKTDDPSSDR